MAKLEIKDLYVSIGEKEILKGLNLTVETGEIHALMGPNGNGKSTLLGVIMGNPKYEVTSGEILLDGENVLEMEVDERSKAGLFLAMQYPIEVPGVTNSDFLRTALNQRSEKNIPLFKFIQSMEANLKKLAMDSSLAHRFLNEGFSGGEKKRNEILQLLMLQPSIAMLDEIDSGLDVDALKVVASVLEEYIKTHELGLIVVSHYERFLKYIQPTHCHIIVDGRIVLSGGEELVNKIDSQGYDWIEKELNVKFAKDETVSRVSLGNCGAKYE